MADSGDVSYPNTGSKVRYPPLKNIRPRQPTPPDYAMILTMITFAVYTSLL
jgi:hypothetical protein